MPVSIEQMIKNMHTAMEHIGENQVTDAVTTLKRRWAKAEFELGKLLRKSLRAFETGDTGELLAIPENVAKANAIVDALLPDIKKAVVVPGKEWANVMIPEMFKAGQDLAKVNFNVSQVSPDLLRAAFDAVSAENRAVLRVGYDTTYRIMNTTGTDIAGYFRRELTQSVIDGIPVQGPGDTLANRLLEGNRLKPLKIRSQSGKIVTRSLTTRANAIARVESVRIVNEAHRVIAKEVLGDEGVYLNTNPLDDRTTDICERASRSKPKTLEQWDNSAFGRPPRLNPFHLCRSVLIGGRADWFE